VVLDAADAPGGSSPRHCDSLTLFSPARYSTLPGEPFPGDPERYPTRDEVVAYLRDNAARFRPTIRLDERVDAVRPQPDGGLLTTTATGLELASRVVICATGALHAPHRPSLTGLDGFAACATTRASGGLEVRAGARAVYTHKRPRHRKLAAIRLAPAVSLHAILREHSRRAAARLVAGAVPAADRQGRGRLVSYVQERWRSGAARCS
jgi:Pyridine nucleotide-disulphide oxidoreductase